MSSVRLAYASGVRAAAKASPFEAELTAWCVKSFAQAEEMANGNATERASIMAATAGKKAKRLGMTLEEMKTWLQSAYGSVWVRLGRLNPGMDLKDVLKVMIKAYG